MVFTKLEEQKIRALLNETEAVEKFSNANRVVRDEFTTKSVVARKEVEDAHPELVKLRTNWEEKVKAKKDIFK